MPTIFIRRPLMLAAITFGLGAIAPTSVGAAETLTWSHAFTAVGSCTALPCIQGSTLTNRDKDLQFGPGINASAESSHPTYGVANARAEPGVGPAQFDLPQLHADVTGLNGGGAFAWNSALADGIQAYRWTGETGTDISVSSFAGALDFTNSAAGFGFVNASLAIISGVLRDNDALGDAWFRFDGDYGFVSDCGTEGAIALGSTGRVETKGAVTAQVTPTCGASTFHVEPGEEFFVWARMMTFHASVGFTDASNTFSVGLSPDLSPEARLALTQNLVLSSPLNLSGPVPEPATWAMMILGFGAVGSIVRRRRAIGGAHA